MPNRVLIPSARRRGAKPAVRKTRASRGGRKPYGDNSRSHGLLISLPRLFLYHRSLEDAVQDGATVLTSRELAGRVGRGISPTQIRKDLSYLGNFGRRGQGYDVALLTEKLGRILGLNRDWRIAIVGFGNLGHALAAFFEYREEKFHIAAIFDTEQSLVGTAWNGVDIHHVEDMERELGARRCRIGIITVPAAAAQEVAQRLARCGVTAILNFAPTALHLPANVAVRSIDLASELSILTHHLS